MSGQMKPHLRAGLAALCIFSLGGISGAEDLTITTYYPSPRGVYDQLRTSGETDLAMSSGNVGIGAQPGTPPGFPSQKLHIWGNGVLPTNVWIDSGLAGQWASLGANTPGKIDLAVGGVDLFINNNAGPGGGSTFINSGIGNVGVGLSTAPSAKLQVSSTSGVNLLEVDDGPLPDTTPFLVNSAGSVGIGTNVLNAKLHVVRTGGVNAFQVDDHPGDVSPFLVNSLGDVSVGGQLSLESLDNVASGDLHVSGGQDGIFYILNTNTAPTAFPQRQQIVLVFSKAGGGIQPVAQFENTPPTPPFSLLFGNLRIDDPAGTTTFANFNSIAATVDIAGSVTITGEATIGGVANDGTGEVVCIKADKTLGTCDTAVDGSGRCTCI